MIIYTIGFTQKTAERFFTLLAEAHVKRVIDVRLKPFGQLSGFSKSEDLEWFLRRLNDCDYRHLVMLAPTEEIMHDYRTGHDHQLFQSRFEALMDERDVPAVLDKSIFDDGPICLLCSEAKAKGCHREFVAARLQRSWPDVQVIDLE